MLPYGLAARYGLPDIDVLLAEGADFNHVSVKVDSLPLCWACTGSTTGHLTCAQKLVQVN